MDLTSVLDLMGSNSATTGDVYRLHLKTGRWEKLAMVVPHKSSPQKRKMFKIVKKKKPKKNICK